ncbi:MAG: PTS glucose/sucrose transporter subunit IIB, partial [Mycoplasmataceae bacterium]|nr:PTS glucose/sucrose transporter subunit IIB [Mycoplasmataceae bacterium]
ALVEAYGGTTNIKSVGNCMTRLRVEVKDIKKVDENKINSLGSQGIVKRGNSMQAIFGGKVEEVRQDFEKAMEFPTLNKKDKKETIKSKTTKK